MAQEQRIPDRVASLTLALVAGAALALAWFLPWWTMEARAPQYGKQVLIVQVSPRLVAGDVFEVDTLGHYVGIQPMASLARHERRIAPFGLLAAILGMMAAPWLKRRGLRLLAIAPAVVMPAVFLLDLGYWMDRSVNDRDPDAALNLTVSQIDAKLLGKYAVGQFEIHAKPEGGLYLSSMAGLLGLGLAFSAPLGRLRPREVPPGALAAGLLLALLGTGAAAAGERRIAPGESIAAALAAAGEGDTLLLAPGIHRERVEVSRSVRLVGQPGAVLDGGGTGTVLRIRAPRVVVSGLTVRNSGDNYMSEDTGIRLEDAAEARIVDTRVEDTLFGIYAVRSSACVLERVAVIGKDLPAVRRGDGIRLFLSSDCRIVDSRVERSRDVILWYSSGTWFEGNVVRNSRYGLHYMYSDHNTFRGNRFDDNEVGASIMYSRGIELTGNSFSYSRGPSAYGLLVKESNDVFVRDNRFVSNSTALYFDDAPQAKDGRAEVSGNLIARNDIGVGLQPLTRRVRFHGNTFLGNRVAVAVQGTGSAEGCEWSVDGRGNYWSDATPYDADRDGISDHPFRLEKTYEALAERHPALTFFHSTPAAQAIDTGSRLFPLFEPDPVLVDSYPLARPPAGHWMAGEERGAGASRLLGAGLALVTLAGLAVGLSWRTLL